jgi:hypothetical protein
MVLHCLRAARSSLLALLTVVLAVTEGGCSNDLSRSRAASLIQEQEDFKSTSDVKVIVGTFWYDWRNINDEFPFQPLAASGLLTLRESGKTYAIWWKEYIVELTGTGQEAAKQWIKTPEKVQSFLGPSSPDATVYRIPLAEKKLLEVTGIATDASEKQAEIEYTWKWNPTPQGKLLPDKVPPDDMHKEMAYTQLYDDGWRIVRGF